MYVFSFRTDPKEYALKQIEGAGLSMSACREIAVSKKKIYVLTHCSWQMFFFSIQKAHTLGQNVVFQTCAAVTSII